MSNRDTLVARGVAVGYLVKNLLYLARTFALTRLEEADQLGQLVPYDYGRCELYSLLDCIMDLASSESALKRGRLVVCDCSFKPGHLLKHPPVSLKRLRCYGEHAAGNHLVGSFLRYLSDVDGAQQTPHDFESGCLVDLIHLFDGHRHEVSQS